MTHRPSRSGSDQAVRLLPADLGLRPADVLRAAHLPADLLSRDGALMSAAQCYALFEALDEPTGERELAIAIADMLSPEVFDPAVRRRWPPTRARTRRRHRAALRPVRRARRA